MKQLCLVLLVMWVGLNSCNVNQANTNQITDIPYISDFDSSVLGQKVSHKIRKEDKAVLNVDGRSVIFFMIGKPKLDSILEKSGRTASGDLHFLFNNFQLTAFSLKTDLEHYKIKSDITTARYIAIKQKNGKTIKIDWATQEQVIGQIFTDGSKEPKVEYGLYSGNDLKKMIQEYFKISNIKISMPNLNTIRPQ